MPFPKLNKRLRHLLLICLYAIYIVILLELFARAALAVGVYDYIQQRIPKQYRDMYENCVFFTVKEFDVTFDPVCYYLPTKGFFRSPTGRSDVDKIKKTGEIRILCLGSSTTFGIGVEYNKSWPFLLQQKLREKYKDHDITVLNAGLPAASSRQIKRIYQKYLSEYQADILIWRMGGELTDTFELDTKSSGLRYAIWNVLYESRLFRIVCVLLESRGRLCSINTVATEVYDWLVYGSAKRKFPVNRFNSDFAMVKQIAKERGTNYTIALESLNRDDAGHVYGDAEYFNDLGIRDVIEVRTDFLRALTTVPIEELIYDRCHMSEQGMQIVARNAFEFIVGNGYIDLLRNEFNKKNS